MSNIDAYAVMCVQMFTLITVYLECVEIVIWVTICYEQYRCMCCNVRTSVYIADCVQVIALQNTDYRTKIRDDRIPRTIETLEIPR